MNIFNYALSDAEISRLTNNVPPPPNVPTTLTVVPAGSALNFSWPTHYLGCRLESNSVSLGVAVAWFTVSGSATTNTIFVPMNLAQTNVFFRLVYP